jgi:tetratricopeptide (TPR) repeat protein
VRIRCSGSGRSKRPWTLPASAPAAGLDGRQREALDRALADYRRAQEANADHASAWVNLGDLHALRRDGAAAEDAYLTALRLDRTYLPAYLNLADLMRATANNAREEEVLAIALDALPGSPEVLHAMGLLRVRRQDLPGALPLLEQAARSDPEASRFAYVYGVALASAGDMDRALRVLEEALARSPYDRDLLTALAAYRRDRGEIGPATLHAQRLVERYPEDPEARALLEQIEALRRERPPR